MTKDVALVLSSGSSRGLADIGAIEALDEHGYRITSVAGCSIGAIVGGMYAAGKLPVLKEFFMGMNRRRMAQLIDLSVTRNHLVKGDKLMEAFGEMIPNVTIESLAIPLVLIATDVTTGCEQVFRTGNLNQLMRASFSIPVVFRPVRYQGMLLMDGGVTNPLPLNRVERNGRDLLVALNVSGPMEADTKVSDTDGALAIINRVTDIMVVQNVMLMKQLYPVDMCMEVSKNHFGSYDYDHAEEIIAYGHQLMEAEILRYEATLSAV